MGQQSRLGYDHITYAEAEEHHSAPCGVGPAATASEDEAGLRTGLGAQTAGLAGNTVRHASQTQTTAFVQKASHWLHAGRGTEDKAQSDGCTITSQVLILKGRYDVSTCASGQTHCIIRCASEQGHPFTR